MPDLNQEQNSQEQDVLTPVETKLVSGLDKQLNISDYVVDVPASSKTIQEVVIWSNKHRELTRSNLALWLVKVFGCSLGATVLLAGAAAFVPSADKTFIKEVIPQVITPQATLLGVALTFYFTSKQEN